MRERRDVVIWGLGIMGLSLILSSTTWGAERIVMRSAAQRVARHQAGEKIVMAKRGAVIVDLIVDDPSPASATGGCVGESSSAPGWQLTASNGVIEDGPDGWPFSCYTTREECVTRATQACAGQFDGVNHGGWTEICFEEGSCGATCADGAEMACGPDS